MAANDSDQVLYCISELLCTIAQRKVSSHGLGSLPINDTIEHLSAAFGGTDTNNGGIAQIEIEEAVQDLYMSVVSLLRSLPSDNLGRKLIVEGLKTVRLRVSDAEGETYFQKPPETNKTLMLESSPIIKTSAQHPLPARRGRDTSEPINISFRSISRSKRSRSASTGTHSNSPIGLSDVEEAQQGRKKLRSASQSLDRSNQIHIKGQRSDKAFKIFVKDQPINKKPPKPNANANAKVTSSDGVKTISSAPQTPPSCGRSGHRGISGEPITPSMSPPAYTPSRRSSNARNTAPHQRRSNSNAHGGGIRLTPNSLSRRGTR